MRSPGRAPTVRPTSCDAALCGQTRPSVERLHGDPVDAPRARDVGIGRSLDLAAHESDHRPTGLVERAHEVERTRRPEVAPPRLGDPVRVGVLQPRLGGACLRQRVEEGPEPVGESAKHRVGERHGALEPRTAHELDRLVHRGVARDAFDEPELVRAETKGSSYGRVETVDAPSAERLDRVVERADALDGAEGESLRERSITLVELGSGGTKCAICVRAVLEHAHEDVERRDACRAYRRRPRSHAS